MSNDKLSLTCPGVVTGVEVKEEDQSLIYHFGKIQTGDELWIFQGKFADGRKSSLSLYLIRDNQGMWFGIGNSEEDQGGALGIAFAKTKKEICSLLGLISVIIGIDSGRETKIDLNPPELSPEYEAFGPGKRVAVLCIGEIKIKDEKNKEETRDGK